jgi:hypothetical protein
MSNLVRDIIFWLFLGPFAFPFFISLSFFHGGRFATGWFPYIGWLYVFSLAVLFSGLYLSRIVLWVGFGFALTIYLSMIARIVYFHGEIYSIAMSKKDAPSETRKVVYKTGKINM